MTNLFQTIVFATRSNDGVVQEHPSLNDALEAFMAEDGYRLDFLFPDGRTLYIHRAEFDEDEKVGPYHVAASKVSYFDATQNHDNVIQVLFGSKG